jgi:RNA polymerase subunit RPABC4/transcription elongation factor Spt4
MIAKLIDAVFGCRHARYSFPVTVRRATRRPQAAALTGTYVVCLDCGKEFAYDWQQMQVITSPERHSERVAELAKHAA